MVCELCGSNEFTKDDDGFFVCDYCRTKYTAEQAKSLFVEGTVKIDRTDEAEQFITLARSALKRSNLDEALKYSNKALEINPKSSEAWMIKAEVASRSIHKEIPSDERTILNMDDFDFNTAQLLEMSGAYRSAIENASEEQKNQISNECGRALNEKAVELYVASLNHTTEYIFFHPITWHAERCEKIVGLFWDSFELDGQLEPLNNIVMVSLQLINGIKFKDPDKIIFSQRVALVPKETEAIFKKHIDNAVLEIKKIDSEYEVPNSL